LDLHNFFITRCKRAGISTGHFNSAGDFATLAKPTHKLIVVAFEAEGL
jgi:hypothetical protein